MFSQRGLVEHFMKNVWDNTGKVRTEKFTLVENCGLKLSQHLCDSEWDRRWGLFAITRIIAAAG